MNIEFKEFPKIHRLSREIIVTEKIDGTNAQIYIGENGEFLTGSRNKWITPDDDNYGFYKWAQDNKEELLKLGVGSHFGEWWGQGIQRRYNMNRKVFSLFNVTRWDKERPSCCEVVPTLYEGFFSEQKILDCLNDLKTNGSKASNGFMKPEGVVIFHVPSRILFKKTIEKDEEPKGLNK